MISFFYDSWTVILKFLFPGIFLGAIYDIFRLLRIARNDKTDSAFLAIKDRYFPNIKKSKKQISDTLLVLIEDILFFLIVAIVEILATFYFNDGEIRIYSLCISAVGFFIYQKTLGRLILFFSKKILRMIRKLIRILACIVLTPVFWMITRIRKFFTSIRVKRTIKKCLKTKKGL